VFAFVIDRNTTFIHLDCQDVTIILRDVVGFGLSDSVWGNKSPTSNKKFEPGRHSREGLNALLKT
jgi:hypothetical protein